MTRLAEVIRLDFLRTARAVQTLYSRERFEFDCGLNFSFLLTLAVLWRLRTW